MLFTQITFVLFTQITFVLSMSDAPPSTKKAKTSSAPIRWGIMGCGGISSDFVGALKALSADEGEVVAVGARTLAKAEEFAEKLGIKRAHEGYESLANDPEVDVVVSTPS